MVRVLKATAWLVVIPLSAAFVGAAAVYFALKFFNLDLRTTYTFAITTFILTFCTLLGYGLICTGHTEGLNEGEQISRAMTAFGLLGYGACGVARIPIAVWLLVIPADIGIGFVIGRHMRGLADKELHEAQRE